MARRTSKSGTHGRRTAKVLPNLDPSEIAELLRRLLERHPDLIAEADELARDIVANVDPEALAAEVESAVRGVALEHLAARAGKHSWGYVEPGEAAWELLEEALEPFLAALRRLMDSGFEVAAARTCAGILLGLYRCRVEGEVRTTERVLDFAPEFPEEAAAEAAAMLANKNRAKRARGSRLPGDILDKVPEWAVMLEEAAEARAPSPPRKR